MLAIIGGTGLYDLNGMQIDARHSAQTPFGAASGEVLQGTLHGVPVLFMPRHGIRSCSEWRQFLARGCEPRRTSSHITLMRYMS